MILLVLSSLLLLGQAWSASLISAENRTDGLAGSLDRLKAQVDHLTRQLNDANSAKARLTQENFDLQHQVQELDSANAALAKAKSQFQAQNEDLMRNLDDESRQRQNLQVQMSKLQADYDNLSHRYDEESEAASTLRIQFSKVNASFAAIKARFVEELMSKTEELEELRRRLGAIITQLEDECDTLRATNNLEKTKTKLTIMERDAVPGPFNDRAVAVRDAEAEIAAAKAAFVQLLTRMETSQREKDEETREIRC